MRLVSILIGLLSCSVAAADEYRYGARQDYRPRYERTRSVFETSKGPTTGGQAFLRGGSGYIDHEGRHLHRAAGGYIDTESGAFLPSLGKDGRNRSDRIHSRP